MVLGKLCPEWPPRIHEWPGQQQNADEQGLTSVTNWR
jgi:hypothetical protein